uniref:hypothetical protein n=1 Tax=Acetobacter musti TaxID=864732 RepID=UPI001F55041A|nr:hypothetical protein [Acetobacter musti]
MGTDRTKLACDLRFPGSDIKLKLRVGQACKHIALFDQRAIMHDDLCYLPSLHRIDEDGAQGSYSSTHGEIIKKRRRVHCFD